jgi:hypothetical protein
MIAKQTEYRNEPLYGPLGDWWMINGHMGGWVVMTGHGRKIWERIEEIARDQ